MGHDITAMRHGANRAALYEDLQLDDYDNPLWLERYDKFRALTEVAYLRRAAWNPLNQVLYAVLGVRDEAYAGCSGNGAIIRITRQQLETARELLNKPIETVTRDPNPVDTLYEILKDEVSSPRPQLSTTECDITPERTFVADCLQYLTDSGREHVDVCFG